MSMQDKTIEKFGALTTMIEAAEKAAAAQAGPVQTIGRQVNALVKAMNALSDDDKKVLFESVKPNALLELERATLPFTSLDASTQDRTEGDKLANGILALVEMGFLEGAEREAGEALVERWTATAPKRTRHSTSGATPGTGAAFGPLGFTVEVKCDRCSYNASTTRDNLNSIRDQMKRHETDKHGATKDDLGRTTQTHKSMTDALDSVMHAPHVPSREILGWSVVMHGTPPLSSPANGEPEPTQNNGKDQSKAA